MLATLILMRTPSELTRTTSSSSSTSNAPITSPIFGVTRIAIIPFPPRCCGRNSSVFVRLPYPFSDAKRITPCGLVITVIETTESSSLNLIPITPLAFLPIARDCLDGNLIEMPLRVISITSSSPVVRWQSISSSSSGIPIAIIPRLFVCENADSTVLLTYPRFVAKNTKCSSSNSRVLTVAAMESPLCICKRFTIAVPLDVLLDSGIS